MTRRRALWRLLVAMCGAVICAPASAQKPFTFAVFGDNRPAGATAAQPLAFRRMCIEIGKLKPTPRFVVGLGDFVYGSSTESRLRQQYADFLRAVAPLQASKRILFAPVPGNHDIGGSRRNEAIFEELFQRLYYSFDWGGCHFVCLDSEIPGQAGEITGEQLEWLRQDLEANIDAPLTFVFVHRPLFPVSVHVGKSLDKDKSKRDALHRLFVTMGVDCVFAGHEHLWNVSETDGLHYVITGGAGAPLYASREGGGFHHYVLVHVAQDREYRIEVRTVAGG
ncbi:MAG: metallophosphoesterase [Armatimonadota bacterium]